MKYQLYKTCENSDMVGSYREDIHEMKRSLHVKDIGSKAFVEKFAKYDWFDDYLVSWFGNKERFYSCRGLSCHKSCFQGIDYLST